MSILIAAIVILAIAALLIYGVDFLPFDGRLLGILKFIIILVAVLAIAQRAGIWS